MKRFDASILSIVVCVVIIAALAFGMVFAYREQRALQENAIDSALLREVAETIDERFYFFDENGVSNEKLTESAVRGMVSALDDPYAQYFTQEEYDALMKENAGEYVGLGISVMTPDEKGSMIGTVYPGGPADEAGVQAGDVIVSINGKAVASLSMDAFTALFSTDNETPDTLVCARGEETLTFVIYRGTVHIDRVKSELLAGNVGYIRITEFNGSVASEFWTAAKTFADAGVTRFVIDLRDNPGGGLNEVLAVTSYIVPRGKTIVSVKSRSDETDVYVSEGDERLENAEIVVLVNGNSASASELFTGALQDYALATVVGTQTFGKGIVQSFYRLSDGSWLKLTSDAYYTPNDVCIHGTGVTPDVVCELPSEYRETAIDRLPRESDAQLARALSVLGVSLSAQDAK